MLFGDSVTSPATAAGANWIGASCLGEWGTIGALVPNRYESVLRVHPPAPHPGDWWSSYGELWEAVASVGVRHTSTSDRAFFAVWEGHGFETVSSHLAWRDPPVDDTERRSREAKRAQLRVVDQQRNATVSAALRQIPRFDLPHRRYYLVEGPVTAVTDIRHPDGDGWRNPDLFWPDDRAWFVATDVDFWSLYVGGTAGFITELARTVPTHAELVALDDPIEIEV